MYRSSIVMLAVLVAAGPIEDVAAHETGFLLREFVDESGPHGYYIYVPENYDPARPQPVMLFLHGAGERGRDPRKVISNGLGPVIRHWEGPFPFLVVFPQCEDVNGRVTGGWLAHTPDARRALRILEEVERDYRTDPARRVLCGWSMGGFGTWSIAADDPSRWSAIAPLSGGGDPTRAASLQGLSVWAVHGAADMVVRPTSSRRMVEAARAAGVEVHYSELPGAVHEVWLRLVDNPGFMAWLLDPQVVDPDQVVWPECDPQIDLDLPFLPAVIAPRAVALRVGNDALRLIGYGTPEAIDPELLTGLLPDVQESFSALNQEFDARLQGLSYRVTLDRAWIQGIGPDRLRVRIGIKPLTVTISRIEVTGGGMTAVGGRTEVLIGHRYPAWLDLELRPLIRDGNLRLETLSAAFHFSQENWFIRAPESIDIQGGELSAADAKSAFVGGLYRRQDRIRNEVLNAVPELIASLEESVTEGLQEDYLFAVWPLPVYQPRVRLGLDSVWVDDHGISAVFDIEIASTDWERAPPIPRRWPPLGQNALGIERHTGLEIRIAAGVMEALSQGMLDTGVTFLHVEDVGNQEFAGFNDPEQIEPFLPGIGRELAGRHPSSRIELIAPFRIDVEASQRAYDVRRRSEALPLVLHAPQVSMPIGVERGTSGEIDLLAEFDLSLVQPLEMELIRHEFRPPELQVTWSPEVLVEARGRRIPAVASGIGSLDVESMHAPLIDEDEFARQFAASWSTWMTSEPSPPVEVSDLIVGHTGLRCESLTWVGESLSVRYAVPQTRLTNHGRTSLHLRIRSPADPVWGERQTIAPGESLLLLSEPPLWVVAVNETGSVPVLLSVGNDHYLELQGRMLRVLSDHQK